METTVITGQIMEPGKFARAATPEFWSGFYAWARQAGVKIAAPEKPRIELFQKFRVVGECAA